MPAVGRLWPSDDDDVVKGWRSREETRPPFVFNRPPVQYCSDGDVVMLIDHDNRDDDDQPDTPARAGFTDGGTETVCILLAVE